MPFLSPRSTERDNQNALRKFPFADRATCTNGTGTIPAGALVDAQLYVPGRTPSRVWLSAVGTDGTLAFADADGVFAKTVSSATALTAVPVTFVGDGGPLPGGVVVFGNAADVAALRSYGGQSFTADQTELAPAALTFLGLPGVSGFRLDDGAVVSGTVKIKGANGAAVATFTDAVTHKKYLRINAVGATAATVATSGFITSVVATSNNRKFVVSPDLHFSAETATVRPNRVINVLLTGADTCVDASANVDQRTLCGSVREKTGVVPSSRAATGASCPGLCTTPSLTTSTRHQITLNDGGGTRHPLQETTFSWYEGTPLGTVRPPTYAGKRFTGYYTVPQASGTDTQAAGVRYYDADGNGLGTFTATDDVPLYAHYMPASSSVTVTFSGIDADGVPYGYGTLHLAAPDATGYKNPLVISGNPTPVPTVAETDESALADGGAEALAEIVLHPSVPQGEVRISLRGLNKATA